MVSEMSGIGTIIDNKYELKKNISKGGMSVVYLAINIHLGNRWAIKEIRKVNQQNSSIFINSLIAEANVMKNLDHLAFPRIVDIIDTEEYLYLVMDYIEGMTLEQFLNEYGPQDEKTVSRWAIELCGALSYLHNQNPPIIYRDMKPSNIMIKPDGGLKIIDFGTARVFNPQKDNDTIALGTRGFAPPEQYSGQTDARSDIYALGMTMKYLITGVNPCLEYSSNTYGTRTISESMQLIIDKCIAFDPENRYQSCEELSNDLSRVCNNIESKKPKNVIKILLPILAIVIAVGITITVFADKNNNDINNQQREKQMTTVSTTIEPTDTVLTAPYTVGMDYEKALSLLKRLGFTVESKEEYNDNIEYGYVIRQSIQAGKQFDKPQMIELVVSKGKEKKDTNITEVSPNSNDYSDNSNSNRENIDYNSGNSDIDSVVSDRENSLDNGSSSNDDNSINDSRSENSDNGSPEQGSNEQGGENVETGNGAAQFELPIVPSD